jgi:SAM-dependent methyltransferase
MKAAKKTHSRELGLILAQQLLAIEDLHYGLWEAGLPVSIDRLAAAQQRYTQLLLGRIERLTVGRDRPRILDVGCGTGHMLQRLLEAGYRVDAVNPSAALNRLVRGRLQALGDTGAQLLEMPFEALPAAYCRQQFDLVLFSESCQYIPLEALLKRLPTLLAAGGCAVICDFFKTAAHGDGAPGDRSFGGGHVLAEFYRKLGETPFVITEDEDLTSRVSPNIALLEDWLNNRLAPAAATLNTWLLDQYPGMTRMLRWLLRKKLARLNYKYLSGHRSQALFEKYKSYRLIVLHIPAGSG